VLVAQVQGADRPHMMFLTGVVAWVMGQRRTQHAGAKP